MEKKMRSTTATFDAGVLTKGLRALLTVPEVQQVTRLSRAKVYELIRDNHLRAVRLPGTDRVMVDPEDLQAYLDSGRTGN
jgi:excisionase family DNA binding protein